MFYALYMSSWEDEGTDLVPVNDANSEREAYDLALKSMNPAGEKLVCILGQLDVDVLAPMFADYAKEA